MSKIENQEVQFEDQGPFKAYSGQYTDPSGNLWRIDVVGNPDVVEPFVEKKPFSLEARPISELRYKSEEPAQRESAGEAGSEEPPAERVSELPGLDVTMTLVKLVDEQSPYVVTFEIDPCMIDALDRYTFRLRGRDTTANVSYQSNLGTVWIALYNGLYHRYTRSLSGSSGSVSIANVPMYSSWTVDVNRASGNPCYTLSGDITVM